MTQTPDVDRFEDIPEEIQQRLITLAVRFHNKTGARVEDIQRFMVETIKIIKIYVDYMEVH